MWWHWRERDREREREREVTATLQLSVTIYLSVYCGVDTVTVTRKAAVPRTKNGCLLFHTIIRIKLAVEVSSTTPHCLWD
jgi:hypothetical protein